MDFHALLDAKFVGIAEKKSWKPTAVLEGEISLRDRDNFLQSNSGSLRGQKRELVFFRCSDMQILELKRDSDYRADMYPFRGLFSPQGGPQGGTPNGSYPPQATFFGSNGTDKPPSALAFYGKAEIEIFSVISSESSESIDIRHKKATSTSYS